MNDTRHRGPRCLQRKLQCVGHILGLHRRAQLPGDDVAREVVEDRRQVEPAPASDLLLLGRVMPPRWAADVLHKPLGRRTRGNGFLSHLRSS